MVQRLLRVPGANAGGEVFTADSEAKSALMLAAEWGGFDVCDLLLKYAAEQLEMVDKLERSSKESDNALAKEKRLLLREPWAMLTEKDEKGRTAHDLAKQNGHGTVATFLAIAEKSCKP